MTWALDLASFTCSSPSCSCLTEKPCSVGYRYSSVLREPKGRVATWYLNLDFFSHTSCFSAQNVYQTNVNVFSWYSTTVLLPSLYKRQLYLCDRWALFYLSDSNCRQSHTQQYVHSRKWSDPPRQALCLCSLRQRWSHYGASLLWQRPLQ